MNQDGKRTSVLLRAVRFTLLMLAFGNVAPFTW